MELGKGEIMAHKKIEADRQRLIDIKKMPNSGEKNKAYIELEAKLGASGCGRDIPPGERDAEHIRSINQALQTAVMVDMCKTASKNYKIAITAAIIALLSALAAWAAIVKMVL